MGDSPPVLCFQVGHEMDSRAAHKPAQNGRVKSEFQKPPVGLHQDTNFKAQVWRHKFIGTRFKA